MGTIKEDHELSAKNNKTIIVFHELKESWNGSYCGIVYLFPFPEKLSLKLGQHISNSNLDEKFGKEFPLLDYLYTQGIGLIMERGGKILDKTFLGRNKRQYDVDNVNYPDIEEYTCLVEYVVEIDTQKLYEK